MSRCVTVLCCVSAGRGPGSSVSYRWDRHMYHPDFLIWISLNRRVTVYFLQPTRRLHTRPLCRLAGQPAIDQRASCSALARKKRSGKVTFWPIEELFIGSCYLSAGIWVCRFPLCVLQAMLLLLRVGRTLLLLLPWLGKTLSWWSSSEKLVLHHLSVIVLNSSRFNTSLFFPLSRTSKLVSKSRYPAIWEPPWQTAWSSVTWPITWDHGPSPASTSRPLLWWVQPVQTWQKHISNSCCRFTVQPDVGPRVTVWSSNECSIWCYYKIFLL